MSILSGSNLMSSRHVQIVDLSEFCFASSSIQVVAATWQCFSKV
uniref:Uncharacterized protein n=1 Tax=Anguilla anguilla TaxID=7936 RepID=A0A0E9XS64_ANGAN